MLLIGLKKQTTACNPQKIQVNVSQKNGRKFALENYTDSRFLLIRRTKVKSSRAETHTANFVVNKNIVIKVFYLPTDAQ